MDNQPVPLRPAALLALAAIGGLAGLGLAACGGGGLPGAGVTGVSTTTTAGSGPQGAARTVAGPPMVANEPTSRRLLSGRPTLPAGFTLQSLNPYVPTTQPTYGAVSAVVTSPTGVEYAVLFSPSSIPCVGPAGSCANAFRALAVGSANPPSSGAVFSPLVGTDTAECGYNPDAGQVGCDTLVGGEYVSVTSTAPRVSTADAVAVLRAAVTYLKSG